MRIKLQREALIGALAQAERVADPNGMNEILETALLRASGETLTVSATNIRTSVIVEVPAEVEDDGCIAIAAKALHQLVKKMPGGELTLDSDTDATRVGWAQFLSGRTRFKILVRRAEDFPTMPDLSAVEFRPVDGQGLAELIRRTVFAASTEQARPHLRALYMEAEDDTNTVRAVCTDGNRLALAEESIALRLDASTLVERTGAMEVQRLFESTTDEDDPRVAVDMESRTLHACAAGVVLSVTLMDATFIPYEQVIPTHHDRQVTMPRAELRAALERVQVMAKDRSHCARLILKPGTLTVTGECADRGEAEDVFDIDDDDDEMEIGLSTRLVLDALNSLVTDDVELRLGKPLDRFVMREPGVSAGRDALCLVMPVRFEG